MNKEEEFYEFCNKLKTNKPVTWDERKVHKDLPGDPKIYVQCLFDALEHNVVLESFSFSTSNIDMITYFNATSVLKLRHFLSNNKRLENIEFDWDSEVTPDEVITLFQGLSCPALRKLNCGYPGGERKNERVVFEFGSFIRRSTKLEELDIRSISKEWEWQGLLRGWHGNASDEWPNMEEAENSGASHNIIIDSRSTLKTLTVYEAILSISIVRGLLQINPNLLETLELENNQIHK